MDETRIRGADAVDHARFVALFAELGVDEPAMSRERFDAEMTATTLVAERGGRLVGYAFYRPMKDTVHLSQLVSAPEARRSGVGRALMSEVVRRSKLLGCDRIKLNVRPENRAAIALYERFGLRARYTSRAVRFAWNLVDGLPESAAPFARDVREIDPSEDRRLEEAAKLLPGMLADQRRRPGRVLRKLERDGGVALGIFDPGFPGVYPLRAPDALHAISLLRAFRSFAGLDAPVVNMMIEDQNAMADELLDLGATLRLETLTMFGPITA